MQTVHWVVVVVEDVVVVVTDVVVVVVDDVDVVDVDDAVVVDDVVGFVVDDVVAVVLVAGRVVGGVSVGLVAVCLPRMVPESDNCTSFPATLYQ
jgi:hypothetical protein